MSRKPLKSPRKQSSYSKPSTSNQSVTNNEDQDVSLSEVCFSSVYSASKNAIYPLCIWSRETSLKSSTLNKSQIQKFHPHGLSQQGELTLIGKTRYHFKNLISDKLGQAKKSTNQLEVEHLDRLVNLDSFVVLGFDSPKCFEWSKNSRGALKLGYDAQKRNILYAARKSEIVGTQKEGIKHIIIVALPDESNKFEILCLKPSPKSLQTIIRDYIRNREPINHDNLNLSKFDFQLESSLLDIIKYPNRLKLGSELRKGESLVSKNGKYRLCLEMDGRLLFYLDSSRLKYIYLQSNVESLWFYDLALLICSCNTPIAVVFPSNDNVNSDLVCDFLMKVAWCKDTVYFRLTNEGTLQLFTKLSELKLVIQIRDDVKSLWNATEPKSECVCYLQKNDRNETDEDESSSSDSSDSEESDGSPA